MSGDEPSVRDLLQEVDDDARERAKEQARDGTSARHVTIPRFSLPSGKHTKSY